MLVYLLIPSYADGSCLNPSGTANADGGIASREKFDFCIVISVSTTLVVGCVPVTVVAGAGGAVGVADCRRNAPSTEVLSAEPTSPRLSDSLAAPHLVSYSRVEHNRRGMGVYFSLCVMLVDHGLMHAGIGVALELDEPQFSQNAMGNLLSSTGFAGPHVTHRPGY